MTTSKKILEAFKKNTECVKQLELQLSECKVARDDLAYMYTQAKLDHSHLLHSTKMLLRDFKKAFPKANLSSMRQVEELVRNE